MEISALNKCIAKLESVSADPIVIQNFTRLHNLVSEGVTGIIEDQSLEPLKDILNLNDLLQNQETESDRNLSKLAVCKLNGGLGTSMGLTRAKSLLKVKFDPTTNRRLSFNEINARQVELLSDQGIPFINLVSFSTEQDVKKDLEQTNVDASRLFLLKQNIHPKIYADNFVPAIHEDDSLTWNPPGHGDFYQAFYASGLLEQLLKSGKKYLFVSNADNLSAYPSKVILNHLVSKNIPFLMEVTRRNQADKKGGHLACRKSDGRIVLRESAQAPVDQSGQISGDFQDVERHSCFNINSMWLNLEALFDVMKKQDGVLPLPLIRNKKTLDPRDSLSPEVYQIETAMGAAIEFFEGAELLEVGRERFAPVKACSDLLLVLSDCFDLDSFAILTPKIPSLPNVSLSSEYKLIDQFERLFLELPSLIAAENFSVSGHIKFSFPLKIIGAVAIVDLRSDRSEAYELSKEHSSLANVRLSISDEGEAISAL
jgi:UTP--glucose-1-phosphate uridylyltransferase